MYFYWGSTSTTSTLRNKVYWPLKNESFFEDPSKYIKLKKNIRFWRNYDMKKYTINLESMH